MTYMQINLAFADGIQELSFDEIGFVSGGFYDSDFGGEEFGKKKKKPKKVEDLPKPPEKRTEWKLSKKVLRKVPVIGTVVIVADAAINVYEWLTEQ